MLFLSDPERTRTADLRIGLPPFQSDEPDTVLYLTELPGHGDRLCASRRRAVGYKNEKLFYFSFTI